MKNELGDIIKNDLENEISEEDRLPKSINTFKNEDNINKNYYTEQDKLNKIITILLVSAITIVLLLLLGYGLKKLVDFSRAKKTEKENQRLAEQIGIDSGPGDTSIEDGIGKPIMTEESEIEGSSIKRKVYYKGFEVVGYLRIPKTNINYPIVKPMSNKSLEVSVAQEHTINGINKPGNTTISGHNYRNEQFFANNYRIQVGDAIYVKDMQGVELKYDVYEIKELGENDKSFVQRNTYGAAEITLSTCTDNVVNRIVIFARYNP